jgi:hypothetical protein
MDVYIIHLLHVVFSLLLVNYPFIVKKNNIYDLIYIISLFILLYSYIILKGECFISYAVHKYENPDYVLGSDLSSVTQHYSHIFKNETLAQYVIFYILIMLVTSSFLVLKRQDFININYIYLFSILSIMYFILLRIKSFSNYMDYYNIVYMSYITFLLYKVLTQSNNNLKVEIPREIYPDNEQSNVCTIESV